MLYYVDSRKSIEELLSKIEAIQNHLGQVAEDYICLAQDIEDLQMGVTLLKSWIRGKSECYFDDIKQLISSSGMYDEAFPSLKRKIERCADYFAFMVPENKKDPMAYESIYNVMIDLSGNLLKELQGILENSKPRLLNRPLPLFKTMVPWDEFMANHMQLDYNIYFQGDIPLSSGIKKINETDFIYLNHSSKNNTLEIRLIKESIQPTFNAMLLNDQSKKYSEIIKPSSAKVDGGFYVHHIYAFAQYSVGRAKPIAELIV